MEPQILNSSISHISKIFNIADIHIRLFKRKDEYLDVFNTLYSEIIKESNDESIIVVTGDIVHTKTEMSPEMVDMTSDFLKNLADICPTIIVPGNHDCYSPDHDILTKVGWVSIKDYVENNSSMEVATFNQSTSEIEFQKPTFLIKKEYDGELINLIGKDADLLVTPTHQVLHSFSQTKKFYKKYAKDIKKNYLIPVNGIVNNYIDDSFYKLLGFSFAEGTFVLREHKTSGSKYRACRVQFHLKSKREINYLSKILTDLDYKFNICKSGDSVYIRVYSNLGKKICEFFDGKKEIPSAILTLNINQMKNFLEGYLNGDGSKNKKLEYFWSFTSISEKSRDLLCTISRLVGGISHKNNRIIFGNYKNSKQQYGGKINLNNKVNNTSIHTINNIKYKGFVYCLTVNNSNLVIRRNEKISICGNCNLNNPQRLDAITPIVKHAKHPNIFYLKETGLYEMGDNIIFSNMSIFDKVENYIRAKDITEVTRKKIAIFHGLIDAAITDTGFRLRDKRITLDLFDGYDMALIGDIHRHQVMQLKNTELNKPLVVYPSSIIQQNYGELLENHGILIWDVESGTYEFRKIKNKYGYATIDIDNGKIVSDISNIPELPRIRIKSTNTSFVDLKQCITEIREKYKPLELTANRVSTLKLEDTNASKLDLNKIRDVQFQNNLIADYLVRTFALDDKTLDKVFEINRYLNSKLPVLEITRNITWKPKLFTYSNMFSYGENNVVDFSKMNGLIGLFSPNTMGKTSLLEALAFCLFDKCSRAFKAANVLNSRKDKFVCELNFEIAGVDYFIKKVGTRKEDKVNVKIDFWKSTPDGEIIDLNGDQRRNTSAEIRKYVGTFEDFMLTALSSQKNNANFIDLGQTEKKDLFCQFMDITIFDNLFELGSNEIKACAASLKEFQKRNFDKEMKDIETQLTASINQQSVVSIVKNTLSDDKKKYNDGIIELSKKLTDIDATISDIDTLNLFKQQKEKLLEDCKIELEKLQASLSSKMLEYNDIKSKVDGISINELNARYEELKKLESELADIEDKREKLKIHVQHKLDKVNKLGELQYDPHCWYCMNNIFVKDAIKTKKEISDDMSIAQSLSDEKSRLDKEITDKISSRTEYEKYQKDLSIVQQLKVEALQLNSKKSSIEAKIVSLNNELEKINEKITLYYKSKEDIENNKIIEAQIKQLKSKMSDISVELDKTEKELIKITSNILFLEKQKEKINAEIQSFRALEEEHASYQYYLEAIKRDGVPYELISKAIPVIESEANNILNQIVDFHILLDVEGKNIIDKIVYDEDKFWALELTSGMERFIAGLAIRVALLNVSSLPRPTFLAIDEGFSSLDSDNASNLPALLDYLKSQFEFTLIISHMDYMRDFVDTALDLKKVDDFSKIVYK